MLFIIVTNDKAFIFVKSYAFGSLASKRNQHITSYKQILVKFRGGLLDLRANSERFENMPLEDRTCNLCNMEVETEYHFLLICIYYHSLRKQYFPHRRWLEA